MGLAGLMSSRLLSPAWQYEKATGNTRVQIKLVGMILYIDRIVRLDGVPFVCVCLINAFLSIDQKGSFWRPHSARRPLLF